MNSEDVKEIVRTSLEDANIECSEAHYNVAINYYNQNNNLPSIDYIISLVMQNEENQYNAHPVGGLLNNTEQIQPDVEAPIDQPINSDNPNPSNIVIQNNSIVAHILANIDGEEEDEEANNETDSSLNIRQASYRRGSRRILSSPNSEEDITSLLPENIRDLDVKKVLIDINDVPIAMIKDLTKIQNNTECSICYDPFVVTDLVRVLPCNHQMHRRCVDDYLQKESYLCPMCKEPAGKYKLINL